ncbi:hypothetical protein IR145_14705 [Streptococcus danieliae]|uniref:DUF6572 domain-containing protein n=1 Tax=Streptococcus acidominimus TaxID=1326 RepID=UPI0018841B34|nr:DUF6572 domain-containing protein [Streptococcus acidominimus]MBF0840077.1 hypothetical protein [Streptococcus acidominimus]MBF0848700.1 hypothetical protein [Streptococcus danieliae]
MAVNDFNTIDAIGTNQEGDLTLLIADHLDWRDEKKHLLMLQTKINRYLDFIQDEEYKEYFGGEYSQFIIDIHFKFGWSENCRKFLKQVVEITKPLNIIIRIETDV